MMLRVKDQDPPSLQTPMVRQYLRIKSQHQDAILFYRMGDFYEMFFDDARIGSKVLNIALTSRDRDKPDAVPLCGVPYHSAEAYIARLVKAGYKVAVCEQLDDALKGSKLVRREVVRVITPGTILSEGFLSEKKNNFLAALCPAGDKAGLAFLDISTGDFLAMEVSAVQKEEIVGRLADFEPSELVFPAGAGGELGDLTSRAGPAAISRHGLDDLCFDPERARQLLLRQFQTATLEPFGLTAETGAMTAAAGAVLQYALDTQKTELPHVKRLSVITAADGLQLDAATQRNLELVRSAVHGGKEGTLLDVLDRTLTPMGGRLLRHWILRPLVGPVEIRERQDGVAELVEKPDLAADLRRRLKSVLDLERLLGRITLGAAGPRDMLSLKNSLAPLPALREDLSRASAPILARLRDRLDPLEDVRDLLDGALREDAPATPRDGGFIKAGFDADLDESLSVKTDGRDMLARLESRERERTGIASLKIRYNRVFGYFIEITKSNLKDVPPDYVRKQTLVGAERFTSTALAEYETRILEADARGLAREQELFASIRETILRAGARLRDTCRVLAQADVVQSLADAASRRGYCRPEVDDGSAIDIKEGRHPVVEAVNPEEAFIPNDCRLDVGARQILIITGPNMAGKSTYLRQVALIVLMAQMGSFVPAKSARIGLVDRIFTRVGATDYLVRGQSTFMVEMTETALILNNATPRSLVVLDEIGRGTSTFDGLSIAWAVAEYLHDHPACKARTLFATHYHQLTELALTMEGVKNCSTAVREWGDRVIFLRRIVEGGSDKSYGIQVAKLAGLPPQVISRAKEIMSNLEEAELNNAGMPRLADHHGPAGPPPPQLFLFGSPEARVVEDLRKLEVEALTPLEALNLLAEMAAKLKGRPA